MSWPIGRNSLLASLGLVRLTITGIELDWMGPRHYPITLHILPPKSNVIALSRIDKGQDLHWGTITPFNLKTDDPVEVRVYESRKPTQQLELVGSVTFQVRQALGSSKLLTRHIILDDPQFLACISYEMQDHIGVHLSGGGSGRFDDATIPPPRSETEIFRQMLPEELMFYYAGISPAPPKLVYRTGSASWPFSMPRGLEAYPKRKQARGVFGHRLNMLWKFVGPKIRDLLTAWEVAWTSIDGVRFVVVEDGTVGPVVVWIGVRPGSLQAVDAFDVAMKILILLESFSIYDVEVEFRESIYRRSVGPPLLKSVSSYNTTVDVRGPLTCALGVPIAATDRPDAQGTMALYFAEDNQNKKLFGLTCHHVVLKVDATTNEDYVLTGAGARRKTVQVLGTRAFGILLESIQGRIGQHKIMVDVHNRNIEELENRLNGDKDMDEDEDESVSAQAEKELRTVRNQLADANEAIRDLEKFFTTVVKSWGPADQRVIGFICRSPPVAFNVSPGGFTEDWAVLELDGRKFKEFKGNFIDLGTAMTPDVFTQKMYPRKDGRTNFKYPPDRLLPLRDIISKELMRKPDMLDRNGEACLLVVKNGNATGVTIGRATGIESFVRDEATGEQSTEWAIYNYDSDSGVFSARGDSGSIVADGLGRIGGMLSGGAGKTETSDVSYVTPLWWLWPRIQKYFPNAHLYPTSTVT